MSRDLTFKNLVFDNLFFVFSLILKTNIHYFLKNINVLGFVMEILFVLWRVEINF
jgi:hypothetical protein